MGDTKDDFLWHYNKCEDFSVRSGITSDFMCPLCSRKVETSIHALWRCPSLKGIRAECSLSGGGKVLDSISFLEFAMSVRDQVKVEEFELLCVIWCRIWSRRNHAVHSKRILSNAEVFQWAASYILDFRNANVVGGPRCGENRVVPRWNCPVTGDYKINTDASVSQQRERSGSGVVIWECDGKVMASFCQGFNTCYQPQIAEAMAILKASL
ncbi:hypothetical protein Q3G72_004186 [Acer saccharum]|nr:hypothetical protein Q3G72_004186 [Acer saccharum]